jgi:hypothetical protein
VRRDRAADARGQRIRRGAAAVILGTTPVAVLAWAGCSDDPAAGGGAVVDPGGTHGAEIAITVRGRGRVTADVPGLDCPSDCFAKYVFSSASADGATGGVRLKASATPGFRFLGWSFDTESIGSRGRGPSYCNPIKRAATQPTVNASDPEITLPFGEVDGTPPEGQQTACSAYTKVPVLYRVTASFETDAPPVDDAGVDGGDGGTTGEVVYEPLQVGATAHQIGVTQNRLYWAYRWGGYSGIAYGATPSSLTLPQTPIIVLSPSALQTVSLFEVDQMGVVYQTGSGVFYVRSGSTSPVAMVNVPGTCSAVAADTQHNVYCRTGDTIVKWSYPSYSTPETLFTGLAGGTDLVIDGTTAYFTTSSAVYSIALGDADGGVGSPTSIVSGRFNPSGLEAAGLLWWLESGNLYRASKTPGTIALQTNLGSANTTSLALDPLSSDCWAAGPTTIYRAYSTGTAMTFRMGLSGVNGVAADSQYVYWTQSDGRVRRGPKN